MASSLDVDLHKAIPKLKGEANYTAWARAFELAMKSRGSGFWEIITGDITEPPRPESYPTDEASIRQDLIQVDAIDPNTITLELIRERVATIETRNIQLFARWRSEKEKFQQKSYLILLLLNSTLESGPSSHVGTLEDPIAVWDLLATNYQRYTSQSCRHIIAKLSALTYTDSMNYRTFVQKFKDLIAELRRVVECPLWVEYSHFLNAVASNPALTPYLTQTEIHYNVDDLDTMTQIYVDFYNFEMTRRGNSLTANALSNKDVPKDHSSQQNTSKSSKQRGGGRGRGKNASRGKDRGKGSSDQSSEAPQLPGGYDEDRNAIWCQYHNSFGGHLPSNCYYNPNNAARDTPRGRGNRGRGRGRGSANAAHQDEPQGIQQPPRGFSIDSDSMFTNHVNISASSLAYEDENVPRDPTLFMIDSGTSDTMIFTRDSLKNYVPFRNPVTAADNHVFYTEGYGDLSIDLSKPGSKDRINTITIPRVWYAPSLAHNLLSVPQLAKLGVSTHFLANGTVEFKSKGIVKAYGDCLNKHYFLCTPNRPDYMRESPLTSTNAVSTPAISIEIAHRRMAHRSERKIRQSLRHLEGLKIQKGSLKQCGPCYQGKGARLPLQRRTREISTAAGDVIHLDICGPISTQGYHGERYFVTFTDEATRFCWVFVLKNRSELLDKFLMLEKFLLTQFNVKIKSVHGDNAGEHEPLARYLTDHGQIWNPTPAYSPYLNPIAEAKNKHLVEPLISIMAENRLPKFLWGDLIIAVAYIQNRLHHDSINMSPYEALYGKVPDASRWRALGCKCWYLIPKEKRDKLDNHMEEGRFIGYSENLYKVYDIKTKKIVHCRDVKFQEIPDPVAINPSHDLDNLPPNEASVPAEFIRIRDDNLIQPLLYNERSSTQPRIPWPESVSTPSDIPDWMAEYDRTGVLPPISKHSPEIITPPGQEPLAVQLPQVEPLSSHDEISSSEETPVEPPKRRYRRHVHDLSVPLRRSSRIRRPSHRLIESLKSNIARVYTQDPDLALRDIHALMTDIPPETFDRVLDSLVSSESSPPNASTDHFEPPDYASATKCKDAPKWKEAIHVEMRQHLRNGTFKIIDRERKMKLLPLRWIFKVKHDGRFKARLVVKGFRQRAGRDFHEIYAAVAKPISFKVFVALAAKFRWLLHHLDITTAFLHADLKESIFIELPEGFRDQEYAGKCGLLMKTMYGLKQSPREWYNLLSGTLEAAGFKRTHADHSVFVKGDLYVLIYVDDILILSPSQEAIESLKKDLSESFEIVDNGQVKRFLGINILWQDDGIALSQKSYILESLRRFGMATSKYALTPYNEKIVLVQYEGTASPDDRKLYQTMIGRLVWIMISTRPDITYATVRLARYARNPGATHFAAIKRVYRYLAGTHDYVIFFLYNGAGLEGFCDADWAGPQAEDAKSTSGYVFKLAGAPISWSSKRQTSVSLSSTESEYIAQAYATQELIWIQLLLTELDIQRYDPTKVFLPIPTTIQADNQGAIALAKNPEFHARTKHINIRYHFLREQVQAGVIQFRYIKTADQAADGMTKPLGKVAFHRFREMLGLRDLTV